MRLSAFLLCALQLGVALTGTATINNGGEIWLDCNGIVHVSPGSTGEVLNADLSSIFDFYKGVLESMRNRALCKCPDMSVSEFNTNWNLVGAALQVHNFQNPTYSTSCARASLLPGLAPVLTASNVSDFLHALSLPSTSCSSNVWDSTGKCLFQFDVEEVGSFKAALAQCPNSPFPFVYLSLTTKTKITLCHEASDCGSGFCQEIATARDINQAFTTFGLYDSIDIQNQCTTGVDALSELYEFLSDSFGLQSYNFNQGVSVCLPERPSLSKGLRRHLPRLWKVVAPSWLRSQFSNTDDSNEMPELKAWDGILGDGTSVTAARWTDGSSMTSPPYPSQPSSNGYVSLLGLGCDQVYFYILENLGFSLRMPFIRPLLSKVYDIVQSMETCRAEKLRGSLDTNQFETRFKFWGMLSMLYQITQPQPQPNLGPSMTDWLFSDKKNKFCHNQQPCIKQRPPLSVGDSCSWSTFTKTGECTFDFTGLNTAPFLPETPPAESLDVSFAARRCNAAYKGVRYPQGPPQMGLWVKQLVTTLTPCSTEGQDCGQGRVCTNFASAVDLYFQGQVDPLGDFLFSEEHRDGQCFGKQPFAEDVSTIIESLGKATPVVSKQALLFCSYISAESIQSATAHEMQLWLSRQFKRTANLGSVMQNVGPWSDPQYPPYDETDGGHALSPALVAAIVLPTLLVASAVAIAAVIVYRKRRHARMTSHVILN
eukprot:CAMPEP_0114553060 /NCGR_PEP_ID=MMETSP0114-20121206/7454_1 /TAXON_ID=31324 /ORGANISM="Goniomonas sp, Strain m" /LENGTH=710 /DNA_ID=CAMNT_0001737973 /DNA_START=30 /DNA_END=2162 /DNA_ORIENTATION=+